jgi:hypothetical protein
MRRAISGVSILGIAVVALLLPGPIQADNLSIAVETIRVSLGFHVGTPPQVAAVRGTRVYHAPSLPYNYFVYRQHHYLFHDGKWFVAAHHDGPWTVIAVERVPPPILGVPVTYYKNPPGHWKKHGPPPWAEEKRHARARGHGKKPRDKEDDG